MLVVLESGMSVVRGQRDDRRRAAGLSLSQAQSAAMAHYDLLGDGKAETGAPLVGFRREERFERAPRRFV
jgi:hypothetical protein